MTPKRRTSPSMLLRPGRHGLGGVGGVGCLGVIGLVFAASARAEPPPVYIGASETLTHEDNLFRAARGTPTSADRIASTALLGGTDQRFGLQHLVIDLAARRNQYRDHGALDNTGYDAAAAYDWVALSPLSGRLGYAGHRGLANFSTLGGPGASTRSEETSHDAVASARYGLDALLSLQGALTHRALNDSAPELAFQRLRQNGVSAGIEARPSGLLTLGAGLRHTQGSYPQAVTLTSGALGADDFRRDDLDATAVWVPSGLSTLNARLSYTRERHAQIPTRDLSGLTASLRWEYQASGRVRVVTEAARDTGAEAAFARLAVGADALATSGSGLSNSLQVALAYEVSAKVGLEARARVLQRDLIRTGVSPAGVVSSPAGSDRSTELRVGLNYEPIARLLTGCNLRREQRSTASSLSYSYQATVTSCSLQYRTP